METPPKPRVPRSTMPNWLPNEYKLAKAILTAELQNSDGAKQPGLPLWWGDYLRDENPYFWVRSILQLGPDTFHRPQFFVWLPPRLLGDRIPCPECKTAHRQSTKSSTIYLQQLGWVDKPRRVVGVDHCVYIMGTDIDAALRLPSHIP